MALNAARLGIAMTDESATDFAALMARVRLERDRLAFRALFEHFGPRVKSLMMKAGAGHAQAEDLVQDVFVTVWHKAELYAPERGTVKAWIFTIARNARIDRLRRQSSRPYEDIEAIEIAADEPDGESIVLASERDERVSRALADLPEEQRLILDLAYRQDMPQSAIAERLSLPLGTVKSRMRLAYAKLKRTLEEVG